MTSGVTPPGMVRLPISGMVRLTTPDGEVVYMSTNRRFVFRGEMTDLWTGQDVSLQLPSMRIDLDRNGVDVHNISRRIGKGKDTITVFVAPECEDCRAVVDALTSKEGLARYTSQVVLLETTADGAHANAVVWCSKDTVEALRSVYLEGKTPKSAAAPGSECDQLGLEQGRAAARLFGIAQLPLVVDKTGMGHFGLPESGSIQATGDSK